MVYLDCWKFEPNERPDMQQVASTLNQLKSSRCDFNDTFTPSEESSDNSQKDNQKDNATKWIENALKSGKVNSISFDELKHPKPLNAGHFGFIMKATWTKTKNYVVYKRLTNTEAIRGDVLHAFIHELQIHLHLDYSERIIRCLGISQGNFIILSFK